MRLNKRVNLILIKGKNSNYVKLTEVNYILVYFKRFGMTTASNIIYSIILTQPRKFKFSNVPGFMDI